MYIIKQTDTEYPKRLLKILDPPEQLYVKGNIELLMHDSIAIVGTRNCTKYGQKYASEFAQELSEKGICIVSGMAVGIDSIAHINSMKEKGKTIAVLGSGFDYIYPEENLYLYHQILKNGGCVISEYPPETQMNKANFPKRNRIISGVAMGVLVVEARHHSGTSITARHAIKQHKEVFCIPHSLGSPSGYIPNLFIQNGAQLVTSSQDILDYYYSQEELQKEDNKPKEYQEIYNLIGQLPISANEIAKRIKKSISETVEGLCMLELEGYITNVPGNLYVRRK